MNTNESVVFNGLSTLLRNHVLGPLQNYLAANKGCQVTVEELAGVLKLTPITATNTSALSTPSFPNPVMNMNGAAPMGFGSMMGGPSTLMGLGGTPISTASTTKSGKGRTKAEVPENERCVYKTIRGKTPGKQCDNRAEAGQRLCPTCKTKKAAQTQLQNGGGATVVPSAAPFPGLGAGFPALPGMQQQLGVFAPMNQFTPVIANNLAVQEPPRLSVRQLGEGMFVDTTHGLAIRTISPTRSVCVGLWDEKTGSALPLTPEKMAACKMIGLDYIAPDTVVQVPQVNTQFPQLPQVNTQFPGLSTNFALPAPQMNITLPSGQQFGLPQVPNLNPNLNGINVFQGIPSVTEFRAADEPEDEDAGDDDDEDDV